MDEKKEKRVLSIELDENVKKVSITGLGDDETVVMKQELTEEELDQATGGGSTGRPLASANRICSFYEMAGSGSCRSWSSCSFDGYTPNDFFEGLEELAKCPSNW